MATFAYLRVSSIVQDEQNQKQGVDKKAKELNLKIDKYYIDKVSGIKEPNERNLGKLLRKCKQNDVIIVSELSRLSRKMYMLFRIMEELNKKQVKVYSVKDNFCLDNSIQTQVLIFAFGLAAQIERDMISLRTKEALQRKKEMGVHIGRPVGLKPNFRKLTENKDKILRLYKKGYSKSKLARKFKVCVKTMRKYLNIFQNGNC